MLKVSFVLAVHSNIPPQHEIANRFYSFISFESKLSLFDASFGQYADTLDNRVMLEVGKGLFDEW